MIGPGNPPRCLEVKRRDGGRLACYHWPAPGPSLLLIPGSWSDYRQFDGVRGHLARDLNLAIVELPGHGRSWPPAPEGSIEGFAREALRVIDELGWKSWVAGGHSIGGMIAIELARQRPRQLGGVISLEGWTHHQVLRAGFLGTGRHDSFRGAGAAAAAGPRADSLPAEPESNRGLSLYLAALGRPPHSAVNLGPGAGSMG